MNLWTSGPPLTWGSFFFNHEAAARPRGDPVRMTSSTSGWARRPIARWRADRVSVQRGASFDGYESARAPSSGGRVGSVGSVRPIAARWGTARRDPSPPEECSSFATMGSRKPGKTESRSGPGSPQVVTQGACPQAPDAPWRRARHPDGWRCVRSRFFRGEDC